MFLLPFDRKINWSNAPVVTITLIVVNFFVFFIVQSGDDADLDIALDDYFSSGLADIEFPRYVEFVKKQGRGVKGFLDQDGKPVESPENVFMLESDYGFQEDLRAGKIISTEDPGYHKWLESRNRFNVLMSDVVWYEYGLKAGKLQISDLVVHMFLHGGVMHLLGNMMFLFAVGFMVEAALGRWLYLLSYVLAGLGSTVLDVALNLDSLVPAIGASGAISGIMGLYAVLFGMRKVRFFYFILVYFDYVKAPALLLFVLWLGYEVFQQLLWSEYSNINYLAHIGGLLTGGILGFSLKRYTNAVDQEYLDANDREEKYNRELEKAEAYIRDLEYEKAVPVLKRLLQQKPDDRQLMAKLNHTAKYQPASEDYHAIMAKIIQLPDTDTTTNQFVVDCYKEYVRRAKPSLQIRADMVESLVGKLLRAGEVSEAVKLIRGMLKRSGQYPNAPVHLLRLSQLLEKQGEQERAQKYLQLLVNLFPDSDEANIGKRLLGDA